MIYFLIENPTENRCKKQKPRAENRLSEYQLTTDDVKKVNCFMITDPPKKKILEPPLISTSPFNDILRVVDTGDDVCNRAPPPLIFLA